MISRSKILDFYLDRLSTGFEPSMYQNKLRILRSSLYTILIDLGIPSLEISRSDNPRLYEGLAASDLSLLQADPSRSKLRSK